MTNKNPVWRALISVRPAIIAIVVFSLAANMLLFVVPLYMLQIYDRVITSRNQQTLIALSLVAALLLLVFVIFEALRTRILVRVGLLFDTQVAGAIFEAAHVDQMSAPHRANGQIIRDVDVFRDFLTGSGLLALCDAPWFPIFVGAAFLLHPLYGWVALGGSVVIVGLTLLNELTTRRQLRSAGMANAAAMQHAQGALRNAEVSRAMGMMGAIRTSWMLRHDEQMTQQAGASDRAGLLVAATRGARLMLQIAILGAGAFLAIRREASAGSIVAASILIGRALQPIEVLVGQWRGFVAARGALGRIRQALQASSAAVIRERLPTPDGRISLEHVTVIPPGGSIATLHDVSFEVAAGEVVAVIGASAAGKSTLLRAMIGLWPTSAGTVRLDGHDIVQWDPAHLGSHVGYLPQTVDLFAGSVLQNIARFDEADIATVIATARQAGCHEVIQLLPGGYNTQIGEGGKVLSGGQRQRVGLARALYGNPRIVLLDEPNAHLDKDGEQALAAAIERLRRSGTTTVVVTHAPSLLSVADRILFLREGRIESVGPRKTMMPPQLLPKGPVGH